MAHLNLSDLKVKLSNLLNGSLLSFPVDNSDFAKVKRQIYNQKAINNWKQSFDFSEQGERTFVSLKKKHDFGSLPAYVTPKSLRFVEAYDVNTNLILASSIFLGDGVIDSILFHGATSSIFEELKAQESHAQFFASITIEPDADGTRLTSNQYLASLNPQTT